MRQKIEKTHRCGVGMYRNKSYCAQRVRVCKNWLHTNTLTILNKNEFLKIISDIIIDSEAFEVFRHHKYLTKCFKLSKKLLEALESY